MTGSVNALDEHLAGLSLIDNHVHGFWTEAVDRPRFENGLNEANTEPLAAFDSGFDTQLGFSVRAHCAPLLGLAPHASPDSYWEQRRTHAETELGALFLNAAGVSDWLVDTGIPGVAGLAEFNEAIAGRVHEIIRLEQVAEQAAAAAGDYAENFQEILGVRGASAVATKSVLAYRGGFPGDLSAPSARRSPTQPSGGGKPVASD